MKDKIILIGAGGHGLVVADIAKLNGYKEIVFLDDDLNKTYHYSIIDKIANAVNYSDYDFFVSIGNNKVRKKIMEWLCLHNLTVTSLVHPAATIAEDVEMGYGCVVMAGAIINSYTKIGNGVIINTGSTVDHENCIGDYVHLSPGCHLSGQVKIQTETWLGTGTIVANNVTICDQCMIGAGGVVIKNIEEPGTYAGVPVKKLQLRK